MKKKSIRIVAALLASLMAVGPLIACSGNKNPTDTTDNFETTAAIMTTPGTEIPETQVNENRDEPKTGNYTTTTNLALPAYSFGSMQVEEVYPVNNETLENIYGIVNNPIIEDDTITLPGGGYNGVFCRVASSGEAPTVCSFHLTYGVENANVGWNTFYLGMRLAACSDYPLIRGGVWMAMRNNTIGLRTGEWPETTYTEVPVDFGDGVLVTVVDDPKTNQITIYAGEEESSTEVAHISITSSHIELYVGDATEPAVTDPIVIPISEGGYTHMWSHDPGVNLEIKNFEMKITRTMGEQENDGIIPTNRDVLADTWVGVDGADRTLSSTTVGTPNDKKVGIFYFLWHEDIKNSLPVYDHTKAYLNGGLEGLWAEMVSGDEGFPHSSLLA